MQPHEFPRRVLFMASGLTPQVVTETVHALCVREPAFVPTEIIVLTTLEGARRARRALFEEAGGRFRALCRDLGVEGIVRFTPESIRAIGGAQGGLEDLRTASDLARTADAIVAAVRQLCSDPDCAVHASIAGGRKSMSYYVGQAISLFGRAQDRLSHVLVNAPFEGLQEFFYPPRIPVRWTDSRTGELVDTSHARVELAEIPFVRMRDGLPNLLLEGAANFSEMVAAASSAGPRVRLRFGGGPRTLLAGDSRITMPPLLFAWYAMFARRAASAVAEARSARHVEITPAELLREYAYAAGPMSEGYAALEQQLSETDGIEESFFREKNTKVNRCLRDALGVDAGPYLITPSGRRPLTRYGLRLSPDRIEGLDPIRASR